MGSHSEDIGLEHLTLATAKGKSSIIESIGHDKDENGAAGELPRSTSRIEYSAADNDRVLRKIDLAILPLMLAVYFLQALDKATIAYASVFDLISDTGLVGDQYSWLGSIVYLAQLIMQPVLAALLVLLPIGKFSAVMVFLWGATLASMTAAHDFGGLLAARFFLGAFEASIAPAFIAITQMWWRRREQTVRVSSWYAMNGITGMFGSLIAYGLGHVDASSLRSYQIIFLVCGLITVAFSFVMAVFMPDSPMEAKFLDETDKLIAVERLRMNQMGVMSREWRWDHCREAMTDLKTWFWFGLIFAISIPSGGISTFGPLIIKSFGFDPFQTVLFNMPFGAVALMAILGGAYLATKIKRKGPVIVALCVPPIAGTVMLMLLPHDASHKAPLLVGYYLISVYPGITPLIYAWSAQNTAGDTKRKCVNAAIFVGQSVGNIIGPQLYSTSEKPGYSRGLHSNLALYVVIVVLVTVTTVYLGMLNAHHAQRRIAAGKRAVVHDSSLDTLEEIERRRSELLSLGEAADDLRAGDCAFDDLTDLDNEEFLFVY